MLARGSLGNPWLFTSCSSGARASSRRARRSWPSSTGRSSARSSISAPSARTRYLRKFYPWYVERLSSTPHAARALQEALQSAETVDEARELLSRAA
jgi:tRNA-dihydrouridine synthase B